MWVVVTYSESHSISSSWHSLIWLVWGFSELKKSLQATRSSVLAPWLYPREHVCNTRDWTSMCSVHWAPLSCPMVILLEGVTSKAHTSVCSPSGPQNEMPRQTPSLASARCHHRALQGRSIGSHRIYLHLRGQGPEWWRRIVRHLPCRS